MGGERYWGGQGGWQGGEGAGGGGYMCCCILRPSFLFLFVHGYVVC